MQKDLQDTVLKPTALVLPHKLYIHVVLPYHIYMYVHVYVATVHVYTLLHSPDNTED